MQRTELASLYTATPADGTKVTVCGWAKTVRDSKNIGFISLSDGSCYKPVQIVFQADKLANYAEIARGHLCAGGGGDGGRAHRQGGLWRLRQLPF